MSTNQLTDGQKNRLRNYIITGSRNYQHYLINKIFKIVCEDGTDIDVRFFISDFKHLTGIQSNLSDTEFYEYCVSGKISIGNINTYQKYNWATLRQKCERIEKIHELLYKDGQKTLLLEFLDTHTYTFPYAICNNSSNMCIAFVNNPYKARSLRKASSSTNAKTKKTISAIFARNENDALFNELIYISDVLSAYKNNASLVDKIDEPLYTKFLEIITKPR